MRAVLIGTILVVIGAYAGPASASAKSKANSCQGYKLKEGVYFLKDPGQAKSDAGVAAEIQVYHSYTQDAGLLLSIESLQFHQPISAEEFRALPAETALGLASLGSIRYFEGNQGLTGRQLKSGENLVCGERADWEKVNLTSFQQTSDGSLRLRLKGSHSLLVYEFVSPNYASTIFSW